MAMQSEDEDEGFGQQLSIENELDDFFIAVKYGLKQKLLTLLEKRKEFIETADKDGNYAAHWAAKSGNTEMLQLLKEKGANMGVVAKSNTGMTPLHWAASEGKILSLRFLLDIGLNPDQQDSAGCTPFIIASQHEQLSAVIFLAKYGVNVSMVDTNGDTALHWAAYKGNLELVGYLSYVMEAFLDTKDIYGQTALHLAVIRGNQSVVEYLVADCKRDCLMKDGNGLTAIDLAVSKKKFAIEWYLRQKTSRSLLHVGHGMGWSRFCQCGIIKIVACGNSPEEAGVWAWRTVFVSNLIASILSLQFMQEPALDDLVWSKYFNLFVQIMWWFCFLSCLCNSPGIVIDVQDAKGFTRYDKALDLLVENNGDIGDIKLCHSCHVQRPLRSKHDKFLRACVHKFDHHCPFVGNTVGRDNHRFFIGLCVFHQLCYFGFVYTSIYYGYRVRLSWFLLGFLIYGGFWDMMMMGLGSYHMQLIGTNMTTNESMGVHKYSYFSDESGEFDNPFCRGNPWSNVFDTIFPYKNQFFNRADVVSYINRSGPMIGRAPGQCCGSGHDHSHGHMHGQNDRDNDDAAPLLSRGENNV